MDFCSIAAGYGVQAQRTRDREAFRVAYAQALETTDRPTLIEVPTTVIEP
ncbi:hypothetical protein [Salinisphaera orenii]